MKKLFLLLLINLFFNCSNLYAQSLSIDDTKKMLCSNKWFLRRLEQDGKMFSVPKELLGLKMVFQSNGNMYSYLPGSKESDATIWTWSITKSYLTIYKSSGKEVNKYRLEDFIGYKLYLTDNDEDDMPTFVFEQAEKIAEKIAETKPEKAGTPFVNYFDESIFTATNPQWRFLYTKGEKLGIQRRVAEKEFPAAAIKKAWDEGFYVSDMSYGSNGSEKYWVMVVSKNSYTGQLYKIRENTDELKTAIEDMQKTEPGYYISHIAFCNNKWVLVGSKGTGYTNQTTIISDYFPEENIKENWKTLYQITSMAYSGSKWVVVMSKGSTVTEQHFHTWDSWDMDEIETEALDYNYLTEAVKTPDKWYMVFSEDDDINSQDIENTETIPDKQIQSKWKNGFELSRTFYN
ncbi:MAG: hypothetical protein IPH68_09085 [Chitinophagaceae bacterium]|nr:hypothetical protein [Chitinophagaceae bacterium]